MFKEIFRFEVRLGFKKIINYIYFLIFFLLSGAIGMSVSGVFNTTVSDTNSVYNSSFVVAQILLSVNGNIFLLITSILLISTMAVAINKDYEYNFHGLLFTKPISKAGYFWGRFLAAFLVAIFVFSGQVIGYYVGCLFGAGKPIMGPFQLINFIEPFFVFVVPNVLFMGIIFFAVTTYTRNTLSAYICAIILLVINLIISFIKVDLDNATLIALLDPFGGKALSHLTQYWTPIEQNTKRIPLEGVLLYNRLLWLGISVLITLFCYYKFSFSQFLSPVKWFKRNNENANNFIPTTSTLEDIIKIKPSFNLKDKVQSFWYLVKFEYKSIAKTTFFIIIALLGVILMSISSAFIDSMYDTPSYPLTHIMMEKLGGSFSFVILILLIFSSGNMIYREREKKVDELIGVTPAFDVKLLFSKYLGLIAIIGTLILIEIITSICIQSFKGYYNYQPLLYLKFGLRDWLELAIIAGLTIAIQVIMPNKYLGFFVTLLVLLLPGLLFSKLEWNDQIYSFNSSGSSLPYSDMNGFSHTIYTFFIYKAYWLFFVLALCIIALSVYPRGKEKGIKARFLLAKSSFTSGIKLSLAVLLLGFLGFGAFIYYNTHILNKYFTSKETEIAQINYEKLFKKYESIDQPRIVSASIKMDIFPYDRAFNATGIYYLKNKHNHPIDTIVIKTINIVNNNMTYSKLDFSTPSTTILDSAFYGIKVIKLNTPIQPGDSIRFDFAMSHKPHGFENDDPDETVVYNGTFLNNSMLPQFGYQSDMENGENAARAKYGLKPKPRMPKLSADPKNRANTYISNDADWIRFDAEISTAGDQIAIAPGYLQKEWTSDDGRKHYAYKMDSPIENFFSFQSARYMVKREQANGINYEIYYQKGHEYNLNRMMNSMKQSIAYYSKNFSPYQHKQVRILEFPLYSSFAQSFPNTIPFSESIGFTTKVDSNDDSKIDVPFYITAHEVGHQWWAHQVIGANMQGAVLMSETMAQYSALMIMQHAYGKGAMKKFLRYEMDNYLKSRAYETKEELPLMLCENQGYIHYRKGSVIMYSLMDYIGEDNLNKALSAYIHQYAFQEPPYTISPEFVSYIETATPDSLKYIITDMFKTITLYDNYVKALSAQKLPNGKYKVSLTVGSIKYRADNKGKDAKIPINDYIDIGVFAGKVKGSKLIDKELVLKRFKINKAENTFEFVVDENPVYAGIDPYNKLIDRKPDNNICKFGTTPTIPDLK